jgi:purine-nucleoside phosphorylase
MKILESKGIKSHAGGVYSSDTFYDERPDLSAEMERHGVLAVEMETAELYILAARYKCRALSILTVSDHLITGEALSSNEREQSFGEMVELSLETAFLK